MEKDFEELSLHWEKHEIFYKTLFEKKRRSKEEYEEYINKLDIKKLQQEGLCVPELYDYFSIHGEENPIFNLETDIAVWKHSRYTPPYMHSHEYFEIVCVIKGNVTHYIRDQKEFLMNPGDICILPNGMYHAIEATHDDCIVINIMLKKSTFQHTFFDILTSDNIFSTFFRAALYDESCPKYLLFRTGNDNEICCIVKHAFLEYYNQRKYYEKILISDVVCLFSYLMRGYEKYFVPGEVPLEFEIMQYLKKHYMDATLDSVAKHFNYSPAYFSRKIHTYTGVTFSEIIKNYRLEMACRLLRESKLKISQICEIIGYQNLEHFNRLFKDMYKETPSHYRKMNKKRK